MQTFMVAATGNATAPTTCVLLPRYKTQCFNQTASRASASLLILSAISIIIPTAAKSISVGRGQEGGGGMQEEKVAGFRVLQPVWHSSICSLALAV